MTTPIQLPPIPATLPQTQAEWAAIVVAFRQWIAILNNLLPGSNSNFNSGQVLFGGPNGAQSSIQLNFGTALPLADGSKGPAIIIGSGPGVTAEITTDQAYTTADAGNPLIMAAGEVQPGSTQPGGNYTTFGGAADLGTAGTNTVQGGTSARGNPGPAILKGGNNTDGTHPPADAFVEAGELGSTGANVHLIATLPVGAPGFGGSVRSRVNSNIMMDQIPIAAASGGAQPFAISLNASSGDTGGATGNAGMPLVSGGATSRVTWFQNGFTGSITFGTGHTMTVANGLITGYT